MRKEMSCYDIDQKAVTDLKAFIPDNIFDAHAHIFRKKDIELSIPELVGTNITSWNESMKKIFGKKPKGGLFMPFPLKNGDIKAANDFLVEELSQRPESRGLILCPMDYPKDKLLSYFDNPQIVGFKPYYYMSGNEISFDMDINDFVPEWMLKKANESKLVVLLHIVKNKALADPENQKQIRRMCTEYPQMKLILAHAARGFNSANTINGIKALKGLENIWFDTSAICEPDAIKAILCEFGPERLMWGSDFPISQIRGKSVSVGDSFLWIEKDTVNWNNLETPLDMTLVGIESLRALKLAADDFGLKKSDIQGIFYDNAQSLMVNKEQSKTKTQDLYDHAKTKIPGGTQLLSKRPEMLAPGQWPAYFSRAKGCETWDLDGCHYYDMSTNGIGSCLLGFADEDVNKAVIGRIHKGSMCTLNPSEEVELADLLCDLHPWAEKVRYARTGGETCAVAVRIARAATGRSKVAICGYHGWHDWYLACNLGENDGLKGHLLPGLDPVGVPEQLRGSAYTFRYDHPEELEAIIDKHGDELAAVIMEPCRYHEPQAGFLEYVRESTRKCGSLLIFDEITIGFRLGFGGSHLKFGINPDIAVFAKALGNGFPIGAIIGTGAAMDAAQDSFISSTYWTEAIGPTAALAVVRKIGETKTYEHVNSVGQKIVGYWTEHGKKNGLNLIVGDGYPCLAHFSFDYEEKEALRTLYAQMMLERGFLAGTMIYPTLAHDDKTVDLYGKAISEVFSEIAIIINEGRINESLKGPVAHSGFKRLL